MKKSNVTPLRIENATDFRIGALDQLAAADAQELVLELDVGLIDADPNQPRHLFDDASLAELADNLRRLGQIHPIEVREAGDRYTLIDGERRWRAAKLAALSKLRALVHFAPGTPDDVLDRQFAANFFRDAMALIDQARYLDTRVKRLGSVDAVSDAIGLSVPRILNIVKTLHADGAAATLRDSGVTRDADTIGAVVEVQKHDAVAAKALVERAIATGTLKRKDAQEAARLAKGKATGGRLDNEGNHVAPERDFVKGRGGSRRARVAEPRPVVLLVCDGNDAQRAQWNKLSCQHGRARLSLVATTERVGCVLVKFGDHSEPFPVDALRILDAHFETEKQR